jgi:hypothetical protein
MNLSDLQDSMPDVAKQVLLPAVLAGAGSGALSGYMSAKARPSGETPQERRRRIMRNALVGTALGGAAGAALPSGLRMLNQQMLTSEQGVHPINALMTGAANNALPIGAGVVGGGYLGRLRAKEKDQALKTLLGQFKDDPAVGKFKVDSPDVLKNMMAGGMPREQMVQELARRMSKGGQPTIADIMRSHELLGEAGSKGDILDSFTKPKMRSVWGQTAKKLNPLDEVRAYIAAQQKLPAFAQKLSPSYWASQAVGGSIGGRSTTPLAELYLKHIRPGAAKMMQRGGWLGRLGLLGGGIFGAKQLQNALAGE